MGVALLLLYAIVPAPAGAVSPNRLPARPLAFAGAAASIANPYGFHIVLDAIHSQTNAFVQSHIQEWFPPPLFAFPYAACLTIPLILCLVLTIIAPPRQPPVLFILAATAVLSLKSQRHIPFFAIAAFPYLVSRIQDIADRRRSVQKSAPQVRPRPCVSPIQAFGWLVVAGIFAFHTTIALQEPVATAGTTVPAAALARLEHMNGRLFHPYDWAGYLIFASRQHVPVFVDGRAETLYPDRLLRDYYYLATALPGSEALFDKYSIKTVLWPVQGSLSQLLTHSPQWKCIYQDSACFVFARR